MKKWKIIAIAAGIVFLAGCGNQSANNDKKQNPEKPNNQEMKQEKKMGNAFSEAMASGKLTKCNYAVKNQEGKETAFAVYLQGKKYASEMPFGEDKYYKSVFDGENMYSWIKGEMQGFVMNASCVNEMKAEKEKNGSENNYQIPSLDVEERFKDAVNVKCEEAGDFDFSIPQDIKFVDQCEMLKSMMKNVGSFTTGDQNATKNIPQVNR